MFIRCLCWKSSTSAGSFARSSLENLHMSLLCGPNMPGYGSQAKEHIRTYWSFMVSKLEPSCFKGHCLKFEIFGYPCGRTTDTNQHTLTALATVLIMLRSFYHQLLCCSVVETRVVLRNVYSPSCNVTLEDGVAVPTFNHTAASKDNKQTGTWTPKDRYIVSKMSLHLWSKSPLPPRLNKERTQFRSETQKHSSYVQSVPMDQHFGTLECSHQNRCYWCSSHFITPWKPMTTGPMGLAIRVGIENHDGAQGVLWDL